MPTPRLRLLVGSSRAYIGPPGAAYIGIQRLMQKLITYRMHVFRFDTTCVTHLKTQYYAE